MRAVRRLTKHALVIIGLGSAVVLVPPANSIGAADDPAVIAVHATSEASTPVTAGAVGSPVPVAVGEQVTFRVEFVLPESTTISLTVDHVVPDDLEYVSGSATVSYVADSSPSFDGSFAGITNTPDPDFEFPASRVSFDSGSRVLSFDFGSIINNDGDSGDEWIVIDFSAVVPDQPTVNGGDEMSAGYSVTVDEGLPTEVTVSADPVHLVVVEPALDSTAQFAPDEVARGGSSTLTIEVSNLAADGATGPAHDLVVSEMLDDWLHVVAVNVTFNGAAVTFGSTFTNSSVVNPGFATGVEDELVVTISGLPVDGTGSIVVSLTTDPAVSAASLPRTISSTLDVDGDSLNSATSPTSEQRSYSTSAADDLVVYRAPLVELDSTAVSPTNDTSIGFTATFDEDVTGFTETGLSLAAPSGATITNFVAVDARRYTFDVSGMSADGDVTVTVAAGAATNSDGRTNAASEPVVVTFDGTAPTISGPDEGSTIDAPTAAGQPSTIVEFEVSGENAECTPASGSVFPIGATEVTCTAEDDAGNTAVLSFSVVVSDLEAPVISDNPDLRLVLPSGASSTVLTYALPSATDNSGSAQVVCLAPSGAVLPVGSYVVTCTATDPSNNTATSSFAVTVVRAPVIPATGGNALDGLRLAALLVAGGAALVGASSQRRRRSV